MSTPMSAPGSAPGPARGSAPGSAPGFAPVGVLQFAPGADRDDNLAQIARLAADAASRGALLVVAPEYSSYFTPRMDASWREHAESLHGPFVRGLAEIAAELGIMMVAGMIELVPGEDHRVSNTVVVLDDQGALVASYRKQHLYDAFGSRESDWIVAGPLDQTPVFAWHGLTVGLQTCYDLRFPEVTRRLVDAGAEVVLLPAEWVRGPLKEHHWRTLVTARAIENTVYVVAADHAPPVGAGNSMVVDPMGVELVTVGEQTDVAVAWISPERVAEVRHVNPALTLRRYTVTPA